MSTQVLISPADLNRLRQSEPTVLIDTRDPIRFAEAHIPGAAFFDIDHFADPDAIGAFIRRNRQADLGAIEEREIKTGMESAARIEVTAGISPEDLIVVGNRSLLRAGQRVETKLTEVN